MAVASVAVAVAVAVATVAGASGPAHAHAQLLEVRLERPLSTSCRWSRRWCPREPEPV